MITHLLRCHLVIEAIAVATWRQLPSPHPVWKLLFPHIQGVLAINTSARDSLISEGGVIDLLMSIGGGGHLELVRKHYRNMTMDSYDLPRTLQERGVADVDKLPRYYYRDDALLLWNAIHEYVAEIVGIYYTSDSDVAQVCESIDSLHYSSSRMLLNYGTEPWGFSLHENSVTISFCFVPERQILTSHLKVCIGSTKTSGNLGRNQHRANAQLEIVWKDRTSNTASLQSWLFVSYRLPPFLHFFRPIEGNQSARGFLARLLWRLSNTWGRGKFRARAFARSFRVPIQALSQYREHPTSHAILLISITHLP